MISKTDLKWLRENGFRKRKNELVWTNCWQGCENGEARGPFFTCDVVFHEQSGLWHARLAMFKEHVDVNLMILSDECHDKWGVPAHWSEGIWSDFPIGCATCERTAKDAVTKAIHRAAGFARWMMNEKYYNISDLERDFPMEKKDGE